MIMAEPHLKDVKQPIGSVLTIHPIQYVRLPFLDVALDKNKLHIYIALMRMIVLSSKGK